MRRTAFAGTGCRGRAATVLAVKGARGWAEWDGQAGVSDASVMLPG